MRPTSALEAVASQTTQQAPHAVVMVRPHHFTPNPQTAADNAFQVQTPLADPQLARRAVAEVTAMAQTLIDAGVTVHLFDDHGTGTPDSVFCNNWFTTHDDGRIALYPMYCPNRRGEVRADIIETLTSTYAVREVRDYRPLLAQAHYLEGTGAMVLDHRERVAYVARSHRADERALDLFCADFGYRPVVFDSLDGHGRTIYHTNVMMSIGTHHTLVALSTLPDELARHQVRSALEASGRMVVELTGEQVGEFLGNALEVSGRFGPQLVLSARAERALTARQRARLEAIVELRPIPLSTIELAGGSARCMLAGVHLPVHPVTELPLKSGDSSHFSSNEAKITADGV